MQKLVARLRTVKRKTVVIVSVCALAVGAAAIALVILLSPGKVETTTISENSDGTVEVDGDTLGPPATNTEDLIAKLNPIVATVASNDRIEFASEITVAVGETVAVWIYSEPKFLGLFEVKESGGVKYVNGLAEAMRRMALHPGAHHISLVTRGGVSLGYVDIAVADTGELVDPSTIVEEEGVKPDGTTEETETLEEGMPFKTENVSERNMPKGVTKVIQAGKPGKKQRVYLVVSDAKGKEISRKLISEGIVSMPVDQITAVGTSTINMNSDVVQGFNGGSMCLEPEYIPNAAYGCEETMSQKSFLAITVSDRNYLFCVSDDKSCINGVQTQPSIVNVKMAIDAGRMDSASTGMYTSRVTYGGKAYVMDYRMKAASVPLNEANCELYGLACGRW